MQVSITFDDKKKCKILNPWNIYVTLKKNYCNNIWLPVCLHFSYLCFAKLKWAGGHCPWQVRDHACCRGETGVPVQSKLSQCYKMCLQCFANTCLPSDAICRACSLFGFFFSDNTQNKFSVLFGAVHLFSTDKLGKKLQAKQTNKSPFPIIFVNF